MFSSFVIRVSWLRQAKQEAEKRKNDNSTSNENNIMCLCLQKPPKKQPTHVVILTQRKVRNFGKFCKSLQYTTSTELVFCLQSDVREIVANMNFSQNNQMLVTLATIMYPNFIYQQLFKVQRKSILQLALRPNCNQHLLARKSILPA